MVGGHKEIFVRVKASPTDALVDQLNDEIEGGVPWEELRNSEALSFAIRDDEIVASAKVQGDDWDLAIYLRALAEVSRRHADVVFVIEFAPDGGDTKLENGLFGRRDREMRAFLDRMKGPRPDLEGAFEKLTLTVRTDKASAARYRTRLVEELDRYSWPQDAPSMEAVATRDGLQIEGDLGGSVRELLLVIRCLQGSFLAATDGGADGMSINLTLEGKQRLTRDLSDLMKWIELEHELRVAQGPPGPLPPDEPSTPSTPRVLARHPQAASTMSGEELVWQDWEDEVVRLQADGTLRVVEPGPRFLSSDQRYAYFQDSTRAAIMEIATGAATSHSVPPAPAMRNPHGFVGTSVLITDFRIEALGRLKEELILLDPDGTTRAGGTFVNVSGLRILSGEERALLIADLDGQEKLVTLALPSLSWSARTLWKAPIKGKAILPRPDGTVVLVLEREDHRRPRELRLAVLDSLDQEVARPVATVPMGFGSVADLEGNRLWMICSRHDRDRNVLDLVQVDLDRGSYEVLTGDISCTGEGRLEDAIRIGDRWAVYYRWDGVYTLENGASKKVYSSRDSEELSIAVSPTGTLAVLATDDPEAVLHLLRGAEAAVSIPLERGGRGLRWLKPSDPASCRLYR